MDFFKSKLLTIVLVLCLVFTIFIGITANRNGNSGTVQDVVTSIVTPIQKYAYSAGQRISNIFYFVTSISTIRSDNTQLKNQIQEYNQKLVDLDRYKRENEEMNKILGFKNTRNDLKLKGANVIGRVGSNWLDVLIVDVGENDGIKKGQYVINGSGLVGQVFETNKNSSKVITILDEKASIPSKVSSTGEDGIVSGAGEGMDKKCKISYLSFETKIKEGDPVVTSNIITDENVIIPSDVLIGFVEKVEEEKPNVNKRAYIRPAVDFTRLGKVMIIVR